MSSSRDIGKKNHYVQIDSKLKPSSAVSVTEDSTLATQASIDDTTVLLEVPEIPAEVSYPKDEKVSQAIDLTSDTETVTSEPAIKAPIIDMSDFEALLHSIQDMLNGNSQEIQALKAELTTRRSRREDTTRIEARLEEEEKKSKELLSKLEESEGRLAASEEKNRSLSDKVQAQEALLEKQKSLEFSEKELAELRKYSSIIVFDTCSIMNYPNLLDGVNDGELVVVPKDVNNELENHKVNHFSDERSIKAQRAITAIFNYKRRFPLIYSEAIIDLIPKVYRADFGEKELNDNRILSVALHYQKYTDVPVLFITDDKSLSNKAAGESLDVWTAKDFLDPPDSGFDDKKTSDEDFITTGRENKTLDAVDESELLAHKSARVEFLSQKINTTILHLEQSQISILQNNGVKTVFDFLNQTEETFSRMKVKKGMPFTARYLKEQESLRRKLESL